MPADISAAPTSERGYDQQVPAHTPSAPGSLGDLPPAPAPRESRRESCWLCGQTMMTYQLLPDGGDGCDDVRWYCLDTRGCTERWVAGSKRASR
jgi:hypothetical protein